MLRINLHGHTGFDDERLKKLYSAVSLLGEVVNSVTFRERVLNFSYSTVSTSGWIWKKTKVQRFDQFRYNNGLTNAGILSAIDSGSEVLTPEIDGEIDIDVTLVMQRHNGVLGFTNPKTIRTWINSWFFDSATVPEIVGNMMHEYLHKLGFDHEFKDNSLRKYTAVYAIGYIARDVAERMWKK